MMLDETLQGLSDPTRRAILDRLTAGEARVTDLAKPFAMSLNSVSKHIRTLERAELVRRRVEGRAHILTPNPPPLDEVANWIEVQRRLRKFRMARLGELVVPPSAPRLARCGACPAFRC